MNRCRILTAALIVSFLGIVSSAFTNQFAVHLKSPLTPQRLARDHGLTYLGQIGSLAGYHLFENSKIQKRSLSPHPNSENSIISEKNVEAVWQQVEKVRRKRSINFVDPLYHLQWYLMGTGGKGMNVAGAWARGYTGKGVVVTILDDGIQTNHPDLKDNYDGLASYDINDGDWDPMPRDDGDNKHGTRCAGEVAATAGNAFCGVGVAYNASIGGVRMLDGVVNDAVEARALSLNPNHIDIYSASWGPEDDGRTVDGPGPLASRAFLNGVTKGRGGKGSIFVWASGNGGRHRDSCSCDGYTNSIYTISVSSATQTGMKPWYLEECASTMATTYSSGTLGKDRSVTSVDMDLNFRPDKICTTEHTGTSASAPIAAGILALALEANPSLTWRDMQHIVIMSAKSSPLEREAGWTTNGAKRRVSHKFGFGLMDAEKMVSLAEQWTTVPPQKMCKMPKITENRRMVGSTTVWGNVTGCPGVRYLEHVECRLTASMFPRGDLEIVLTSPQGTSSKLLQRRPHDTLASEFQEWPFLSVHYWGEDPTGTWTLTLRASNKQIAGKLEKWQLILYGTEYNPVNLQPAFRSSKKFSKQFPIELFDDDEDDERGSLDGVEGYQSCHPQCDPRGCYGPGPKDCFACQNYKMDGECIEVCPDGYYGQGKGCRRCHTNCKTCVGRGPNDCVLCSTGLFLVTDLGLCLHSCPKTYFEDLEKAQCISCRDNCASCDQNQNVCSSCEDQLVLYNGSCLASCPSGTFEDTFKRCSPCYGSCRYCTGPGPRDCRDGVDMTPDCTEDGCPSCPHGLMSFNSTCLHRCPSGYYGDRSAECRRCPRGCSECRGGRSDECLSCLPGWSLGAGRCRQHCPRNMYYTPGGCVRCHHFCSTCNGGGPYGCTSCRRGRYETSVGVCATCDPSCLTCSSSPVKCTSCPVKFTLRDGQCSQENRTRSPPVISPSWDVGRYAGKRMSSSVETTSSVDGQQNNLISPTIMVALITGVACLAIVALLALVLTQPRGTPRPRVVLHTDRGTYTSAAVL